MPRRSLLRRIVPVLAAALLLNACQGDPLPPLGVGDVTADDVIQSVAAAATLDPAARVEVVAAVGGEVEELLVADGDVVAAGDPLARLSSDSIDLQVAQAQGALEAADAFVAAAAGGGVDVAPVLGAFRGQLDAVFPPLIASLEEQLAVLEAAVQTVASIEPPTLPPAPGPGAPELPDGLELPEGLGLPEGFDPASGDAPSVGPTLDAPVVDTEALEASIADARAQLARTRADYQDAARGLEETEAALGQSAATAEAGQVAAAEAQRDQAALALEAARSRIDDLTVLAPRDGVVELARAADGGAAGGLADLPEGLANGDGEGAPGGRDLGDIAGMLGGSGAGGGEVGPIADGVSVGPGQTLLTIYDLSGFTARAQVDEIDIIEVEEGQSVVVLVDAFPDAQVDGRVEHVALAPETNVGGGAMFAVTVALTAVPEDVSLRVGLSASVEIAVRELEAETTVPTGALLRRGDDEVVHVIRDEVAVAVPVQVLAIGDDRAAVVGDLAIGEVVITTGVEQVEDGMTIDPDRIATDGADPGAHAAGMAGPRAADTSAVVGRPAPAGGRG